MQVKLSLFLLSYWSIFKCIFEFKGRTYQTLNKYFHKSLIIKQSISARIFLNLFFSNCRETIKITFSVKCSSSSVSFKSFQSTNRFTIILQWNLDKITKGQARDWQHLLATPRFRYIEVIFGIFYYYWCKEGRSLYRGLRYIEVRYIEFLLYTIRRPTCSSLGLTGLCQVIFYTTY